MRQTVGRLLAFVESGHRAPWVGLAFLAVAVAVLEVVSALLVFAVTGLLADPQAPLELPGVGDVGDRLGVASADLVLWAMGAVAVFFVLRMGVALFQSYAQGKVAQRTGVRLASRLLAGYLTMPYVAHLQRRSADLIRNVNDAVRDVVDMTLVPALRLASEALVIAGLTVALVVTAPRAAGLAVVLFAPLMLVLLRAVQPRITALGRISHDLGETTIHTLQQSLHGFREITLLGRAGHFHRRYVDARAEIARTRWLRQLLGDVPRLSLETGMILFVALFVVLTVRGGGSARESLAVIGMFAYVALRVMPSLNRVILQLNELGFGAAAAAAVQEDLHEAAGRSPTDDDGPGLPLDSDVRLVGVRYRYPGADRDALVGIDLRIPRGESLGLVGPTGGGKTTLIDVTLGLLPPDEGAVLVDGRDIHDDLRAWQRNVGVVPQHVYLFDDTLRRNIALGLDDDEVDEERLWEAVRLAQLEEFVAGLPEGLDTMVGEQGVRISGGQRQRVAIARALYSRPAVLALDEGTSALDTVTEAELVAALERLRGRHTMLVIAHRLSTVRQCDRIAVIEDGRVVDVGPWDELVDRSPAFRKLVAAGGRGTAQR